MHALVKPVAAALATMPFAGAAVEQHVRTLLDADAAGAACEARVFAGAEPSGRSLLATVALADALAIYGERVAGGLCPRQSGTR